MLVCGNVLVKKTVADVIRTSLGPKAMLKMILSMSGSIVLTNDGNAILRELDVTHPSAKAMIDLSRAQDEEVGDGTTSVIILAGEILAVAEPWVMKGLHPRVIIAGFTKALDDALSYMKSIATSIDMKNRAELLQTVKNCMGTKFVTAFYPPFMSELALDAAMMVAQDVDGRKDVDIKRYVRIEKIPGGRIEDCCIIPGVVLNKDVTHAKMSRYIEKPRIILLDCNLEYKKGDNQTSIDVTKAEHWEQILQQEEDYIKRLVENIAKLKPTLVCTEKGISDLAQHYFVKYGITALRRLKKTDNDRLARASGATIVNQPELLRESDVGTRALLFEVKKIGDEYYSYITCDKPKACTILLRGTSKDTLNEVERNLHDALAVARNIIIEPMLLPGGGATEMAVATKLLEKSKSIPGVAQYPYQSLAISLEVIPRTLIQNCGANVMRTITQLRAKHAGGKNQTFGVDGETGAIRDVREFNLLESYSVKVQTLKTAVEAACMLLRVDQIVSGLSKKGQGQDGGAVAPHEGAGDEPPPGMMGMGGME
jgi:T-complex protein 1 subunit gamma